MTDQVEPDPSSLMQDPGGPVQDPSSLMQDPGGLVQDPSSLVQDSGNTAEETEPATIEDKEDDSCQSTKQLSHVEALQQAKELLSRLFSDPFLSDLPPNVSVEEVRSTLALEQGKAITLNLRKLDGEVLPIVVLQGAMVGDLMKAVEREVTRKCLKQGVTSHISWRYVWRTYWLGHSQQRLEDRNSKLSSFGITNRDEITFVKKLKRENRGKAFRNRGTADYK